MPSCSQQLRRLGWLVAMVLCSLVAGCGGKDRTLYSPPDFSNPFQARGGHAPAVRLIVPGESATFHAPAEIRLMALATPNGSSLGPDESITRRFADADYWDFRRDPESVFAVEFRAGTNRLGVQNSGLVSAMVKVRPGQAQPMVIMTVGYPAVEFIWHDVPAGVYTLTATATNRKGMATVSAPAHITVLP